MPSHWDHWRGCRIVESSRMRRAVEPVQKEVLKFIEIEEVHEEATLGSFEIANCEAGAVVRLNHVVLKLDIRSHSVYSQRENPTRPNSALHRADVLMAEQARAVLEDLDSHDRSKGRFSREGGEITMYQPVRPLGQLLDRRQRDVNAGEVQTGIHERQVIPSVPQPM
jgi:hypothetical protein